VDDLGPPSSYLALAEGTPVLAADGERLGTVAHVLAAEQEDIFDGIVVAVAGGGHRFLDAPLVEEIFERGVLTTLPAADAGSLPEPAENPAAVGTGPDDLVDEGLADRLRRAWDALAGRR
jgi:hypothetical protein